MGTFKTARGTQPAFRVEPTDVAGFLPLIGTPIMITKLSDARGKLADVSAGFKAVTLRQVADKYGRARDGKIATASQFGQTKPRLTGMERTPAPARVLQLNEYRPHAALREASAPKKGLGGKVLTGFFGGEHRTMEGTEEHRALRNRAARTA